MKTLLVMVINALLFVVIVALALVLVFVGLWLGLGLDNTPQNVWIGLAALAGAIVLLSFLWRASRLLVLEYVPQSAPNGSFRCRHVS